MASKTDINDDRACIQMRISVFPKGELDAIVNDRTMTVFDWINEAKTLPIEGLELYSGMFWDTSNGFVDRVGEAIADAGLTMPMLCASPDFTHPDPEVRKRELDKEAEMIRITHRISGAGASTRLLSGQAHPEVNREQGLDWVTEAIEQLMPLARELDITLSLENHYKDGSWKYPEFAQKREVFLELLSRVPEPIHFGVQFDPSNAVTAGDDSADFLEAVIGRVVTMQASDRSLTPGHTLDELRTSNGTIGYSPYLQHGVIGKGLNDYPRIFRTLVDNGYDGWISIEDGVNGMDEMRQSVEYLRWARDEFFGGSNEVYVDSHARLREAAGLPNIYTRSIMDEEGRV